MSAAAPSQNFWPEIVSVCAMPDWYRAWPAVRSTVVPEGWSSASETTSATCAARGRRLRRRGSDAAGDLHVHLQVVLAGRQRVARADQAGAGVDLGDAERAGVAPLLAVQQRDERVRPVEDRQHVVLVRLEPVGEREFGRAPREARARDPQLVRVRLEEPGHRGLRGRVHGRVLVDRGDAAALLRLGRADGHQAGPGVHRQQQEGRGQVVRVRAPLGACVGTNQCVGCTRQFFTKSFLGDDAADLARSSGEEPASPRHRAGVASMAWRTMR